MFKKTMYALLLVLLSSFLPASVIAEQTELTTDPFVQQSLNRENWEPDGKYFGFGGARGTVSDRSGQINLLAAGSVGLGSFSLQTAIIQGDISYITRFLHHGYDEHSPFDDASNWSDSARESRAGGGQVNYDLHWSGRMVHPADAYDGPRGGGYPAPGGARDEYSYHIAGIANGIYRVNMNSYDYQPASLADRNKTRISIKEPRVDAALEKFDHDLYRHDLNTIPRGLAAINNTAGIGMAWWGSNIFVPVSAEIEYIGNVTRRTVDDAVIHGFLKLSVRGQHQYIQQSDTLKNTVMLAAVTVDNWLNQHPNTAVYIETGIETLPWIKVTKELKTGIAATQAVNKVKTKLGGVVRISDIPGMSFNNGIKNQGIPFENWVQSQLPPGTRHLSTKGTLNHPVFDHFEPLSGKAISTKTIDTVRGYKNPKRVTSKFNSYIDKMIKYQLNKKNPINSKQLNPEKINIKEMQLGIPYNTPPAKMQAIQNSIDYARRNGIDVIVTRIK